MTFVIVYALTTDAENDIKGIFETQLSETMAKVRWGNIQILMSDVDAKRGSSRTNWEHGMGNHGLGVMNDNGEMFAEFCSSHSLVTGGTLFPHKI